MAYDINDLSRDLNKRNYTKDEYGQLIREKDTLFQRKTAAEDIRDEVTNKIKSLKKDKTISGNQKKTSIEELLPQKKQLNTLVQSFEEEATSLDSMIDSHQKIISETESSLKNSVTKDLYDEYINIKGLSSSEKIEQSKYDDFMNVLDTHGSDFLTDDGMSFVSKGYLDDKETNLFNKGLISGDYTDYDEFIEARKQVEKIKADIGVNRKFNVYNSDSLFDENGFLKDVDRAFDGPVISASEAFRNWQSKKYGKQKSGVKDAGELDAIIESRNVQPQNNDVFIDDNITPANYNGKPSSVTIGLKEPDIPVQMPQKKTLSKKQIEQKRRRQIKDDFKKNGNINLNEPQKKIEARKKQEEYKRKREFINTNSYKQTKDKVDKYYKKKDAIKETLRKRDEENKRKVGKYYKRKKDVIEKIKNKEAVVNFGVDVENLRKHKKAQQLKDEAYKSTTLTTEERQKLFDEAKELEDGYDYNDTKARIEGSDREIAERYLNKQYGIQKNAEDYVNLVNDLEIAGSDSFDLDGNNVGETMGRKIELWTKGLFTGDFKEYEEYKNAAARLESFKGNREYNLYDVDELFNEKDELKNIDDVLNLSPKETKKAQDIFDEWQKERIENFKGSTVKAATSEKGAKIAKENLLRSSPKAKRLLTVGGAFGVGTNLFFGAQTYSEERKNGRTVLGAGVRAVADFALGEALGPAYMGIMMAEALPRVAVKGVETLGKLTREKNNMQRHEAFGYASFQDTQQLATMRQSGMEMAKMANYNLQQTLMGNEAKYLHR